MEYGVCFELHEARGAVGDKLSGMIIVISGVFRQHSRDESKAMIEANGGKNASSISSKTTFVLAGDNMGPAKYEKAQKLGIKLLSEEDFLGMLGERRTDETEKVEESDSQQNKAYQLDLFN